MGFLENINYGDEMNLINMCILVFLSRIVDVSLGTIRTTIVVKGRNIVGSAIGFIEVTVWFIVVEQVLGMTDNNIYIILSYALGFSAGTYIGGKLTKILFKTKLGVQVITSNNSTSMVKCLRDNEFAVSVINVNNRFKSKKYMLFMEIDSNRLDLLRKIIKKYDSKAFMVVNETMFVQNGYFGLNK